MRWRGLFQIKTEQRKDKMKPTLGTKSVLLGGIAAATTERTANLDCQGGSYATIDVCVGVELNTNSTNVAVALLESDDTTASNFATFNSSYQRTVDNTSASVATFHVDLEGRKRYLRVRITPDTTTNGTVITTAVATLYKSVISTATTMLGPDVVVG
jgi:hypothetical protein